MPEAGALVHTACTLVFGRRDHACGVDPTVAQLLQRCFYESGGHARTPCTLRYGDRKDLGGRKPVVVRPTPVAHRLPDPTRRPKGCGSGDDSDEDRVAPEELAIDAESVVGDSDEPEDTHSLVDQVEDSMT